MSTDNKMSIFEDVWLQVFALLLIVSGVFTLHYMLSPAQPQQLPALTISPPAAVQPEPARTEAPAAAPAPAEAAPEKPAAPKLPDRWVVGTDGGPGINTKSLSEAITKAADGDSIVLRPGTYEVSILTSKSLTISGEGSTPQQVKLTNSLNPTFAVSGGRMVMQNLTIANDSQIDYWALSVSQAVLVLRNVHLRSSGNGLKIVDADLEASGSELEAGTALFISGKSRVKLTTSSVSGRITGVSVQGSSANLQLDSSQVSDGSGVGLKVSEGAWARISDTTISGNRYAGIMVGAGAEVRASKSQLTGNGECGAYIEENGKLILEKVTLTLNKCGVGFAGVGILEARNNKFADNSMGAIAIIPLNGDKARITGGGNTGLLVPGEKPTPAKKRPVRE